MQSMAGINWQGITEDTANNADIIAAASNIAGSDAMLTALGKNADQVTNWKDILANDGYTDASGNFIKYTDEQKSAAKKHLQDLFTQANQLSANVDAGLYDDRKAEELAASTMSDNELAKHERLNTLRAKAESELTDEERAFLEENKNVETISAETV
jgi:hypothetical protein